MKKFLSDLLEVRAVIAIVMAGAFIVMAIMGKIDSKIVEYVFVSVFSFFFGQKTATLADGTTISGAESTVDNIEGVEPVPTTANVNGDTIDSSSVGL